MAFSNVCEVELNTRAASGITYTTLFVLHCSVHSKGATSGILGAMNSLLHTPPMRGAAHIFYILS